MRQYRWFHNRIGKFVYHFEKDGLYETKIKDRDHAFEVYRSAYKNGWDFYEFKDLNKLTKSNENL